MTRTDITSGNPTIKPSFNIVGEYIQMKFSIVLSQSLSTEDYLVFRFPYNYELKYLSDN